MSRVVHFEIQADDVERAKAFYATVFGWSFDDYSQYTGATYWGVLTGPQDQPGINGGLLQRPVPAPATGQGTNSYVCTIGITDYDQTESRILEAAGRWPCRRWRSRGWPGRATTSTPRATRSASTSPTPTRRSGRPAPPPARRRRFVAPRRPAGGVLAPGHESAQFYFPR